MSAGLLVVDASVLVAVVSQEPAAAGWQGRLSSHVLTAPRLARLECAIALSRKARRGVLAPLQARGALDDLDRLRVVWAEMDDTAIDRAFALSLEVGHELADCLYLALALDTNSPLATVDAKLAAAATRRAVTVLTVA